jgi:signal transduction histidine kinase
MHPGIADESPSPAVERRSPAGLLLVWLGLALLTIAGVGVYTFSQVRDLRDEQTAITERNRKDALQLLRIQNDLSSLASMMRDMTDGSEPYPMRGWKPAFDRVRRDLAQAVDVERSLAPAVRPADQQSRLERSLATYWSAVDRTFRLADAGDEAAASRLVRDALIPQHRELDGLVSQFLVVNNRMQEEAAQANRDIYDRVGREILLLVAVLLAVVALAGGWIVAANRRAFAEVRQVTTQLRTLSWRALRFQEELQRSISRELHDDFGQIVTAIGTLVGHARRHVAGDAALTAELDKIRSIAQEALDRIRTRSQWLHPGILDDFGLSKALARSVEQFERQSRIRTRLTTEGPIDEIRDDYAIHIYRIVQEALSNIARHSGSSEAWVRLSCVGESAELDIEDRGVGSGSAPPHGADRGLGLVSMRERAELMGGQLRIGRPAEGGFTIEVRVPACLTPARERTAGVA